MKKLFLLTFFLLSTLILFSQDALFGRPYYFIIVPLVINHFLIIKLSVEILTRSKHDFDSWDVTDDEYRDVYENLKPEHKNTIKDIVRSELGNYDTLSIGTDLTPNCLSVCSLSFICL